MREVYSVYDSFAWLYNRYWGDFARQMFPLLQQHVLNDLPRGSEVLDVACGSGQLAAQLTKAGYPVTGIDGSDAMLAFARLNAPQAEFIHADVRHFNIAPQFHAAFCIYDSLNHILDLSALLEVFNNIWSALLPGAVFWCDFNMESGYVRRWQGTTGQVAEEHAYILHMHYTPAQKLGTFDMTMFFQGDPTINTWERRDVHLTQRAYSLNDLRATLAEAGFVNVQVHHLLDDFRLGQGDGERTIFVANKPS